MSTNDHTPQRIARAACSVPEVNDRAHSGSNALNPVRNRPKCGSSMVIRALSRPPRGSRPKRNGPPRLSRRPAYSQNY
jgi:hypothetical protein